MGRIELNPTCDQCGGLPEQGFILDSKNLDTLCLACAYPDEADRLQAGLELVKNMQREFVEAHGREPASIDEFTEWAAER